MNDYERFMYLARRLFDVGLVEIVPISRTVLDFIDEQIEIIEKSKHVSIEDIDKMVDDVMSGNVEKESFFSMF